jgi:hypothetical protein
LVEYLLKEDSAATTSAPSHTSIAVNAGSGEHQSPAARRLKRIAKRVMRDQDVAHGRKVLGTSRAVQCDLGPRVVVRKERVLASPRREHVLKQINLAASDGSHRPHNRTGQEEDRRLGDEELVQTPFAAPKNLVPAFNVKRAVAAPPVASHEPPQEASEPPCDGLSIRQDITRSNQNAVQYEGSRVHDVGVDEELSFAAHLVQRRDVVADYVKNAMVFAREAQEYLSSAAFSLVPTIVKRARRLVFGPLEHYVSQLIDHCDGPIDRANAERVLNEIVHYTAEEAALRREDARVLWSIGLLRIRAERLTTRAGGQSAPQKRNTLIARAGAALKQLAAERSRHRQLRTDRLGLLRLHLGHLFEGDNMGGVPQVPQAVTLVPYTEPHIAPLAEALARQQGPTFVPRTRTMGKAASVALKAAGVSRGAVTADIHVPASSAALRQMLLEFDGQLTEMPRSMEPDDPAEGDRQTMLETTILPVQDTKDDRPDAVRAVSISGAGAASVAPRATDASEFVVGRLTDTELMRRRDLMAMELLLQQRETHEAAVGIDSSPPPIRMTLPHNSPAATGQSTNGTRDAWLTELNDRILEHRRLLLAVPRELPIANQASPPRVPLSARNLSELSPRTVQRVVSPQSPLPPVRGGKAGPEKGARTPRPGLVPRS